MDHVREKTAPSKGVAFLQQVVDLDEFRSLHAKKSSLGFHAAVERQVVAVHHHRSACVLVKLGEAADMANVGVSADDGLNVEFVPAEKIEDALDLITRVDDNRFAGDRIADDGTVALKHAHRQLDIDHFLLGSVWHALGPRRFAHPMEYIIPVFKHPSTRLAAVYGLLN